MAQPDRTPPPKRDSVYRWSRMPLHLDDKQQQAVARAAAAGEAAASRSTGDWRSRTSPARAGGAAWKAAADALRADGFDDYLTHDGFLKLKVWAARTGVQYYSDGLRTWGEYRSVKEVGDAESLKSWGLKPVTDDHPPELVVPDNYTKYAKGSCGEDAQLTMPAEDGHRYVELTILVGDLATLIKIRDGKLELSAGYTVIIVDAPAGSTDFDGSEYEFLQTDIRINHLAVVEEGRAGPLACIKIDGAAWQVLATTKTKTPRDSAPKPKTETTDMKLSTKSLAHLSTMIYDAKSIASEKDAMTPELAAMLSEIVKYSLMGEEPSPELMAKLAAALEMQASEVEGMGAEMSEVELADNLVVAMTSDQKATWDKQVKARDEAQAALKTAKDEAEAKAKAASDEAQVARDKAAAAAKANADAASDPEKAKLAAQVSDQAGEIVGLRRTVDRLERERVAAAKKALIVDIAGLCPDLVKRWSADGGLPAGSSSKVDAMVDFAMRGTKTMTVADMKAKVLIDMDPGCKAEIDEAKKTHEDNPALFDSFISSLYRTQVGAAKQRKASHDESSSPPQLPPHLQHLNTDSATLSAQIARDAYGVGAS